MKNLENNLKILSLPAGILTGLIIVIFIALQIFLNNLSDLNEKNDASQKSITMLQQKLNLLQRAAPQVSSNPGVVLTALPAKNSALAAIAQIQAVGASFGLSVDNLISNNIVMQGEALSTTQIQFESQGSYQNIASFIKVIENSAPITKFSSIKIVNSFAQNNSYLLTATAFSFWSPLPTTFPAIDQPILSLTSDEQKILSQVNSLQNISTTNGGTQGTVSSGRPNPFSQ